MKTETVAKLRAELRRRNARIEKLEKALGVAINHVEKLAYGETADEYMALVARLEKVWRGP